MVVPALSFSARVSAVVGEYRGRLVAINGSDAVKGHRANAVAATCRVRIAAREIAVGTDRQTSRERLPEFS